MIFSEVWRARKWSFMALSMRMRWSLQVTDVFEAPPADRGLLDFAVQVLHRAGRLSVERFYAGVEPWCKADGSEVTTADIAVEELMREQLSRRTPDDGILGEECGEVVGRSGRRWVIDPIDGTYSFANRIPTFCNNLAYEDEYGPAIGVINMPVQQELVFAGRGPGLLT